MRIYFSSSATAAHSDLAPARWRRPFLKWLDGVEAGWAIPLLLVGFIVIWMMYLQIAYLSGDLHPDVLETWSFGRTWQWGNHKHPPLLGWVVYLWTSVFPLTDWSFQLLAMINSAIALWSVDLISRHFVRGEKRIVVLLMLMLLPVYQFHAQRFNANAILLATWPLATYCFLRSFETLDLRWAAAAGVTAAFAMLGKYYSVFLVGGFIAAAIAPSAASGLFRFFRALGFHCHRPVGAGASFVLAGHNRHVSFYLRPQDRWRSELWWVVGRSRLFPARYWRFDGAARTGLGCDRGLPAQTMARRFQGAQFRIVAAFFHQRRNPRLAHGRNSRPENPFSGALGLAGSVSLCHRVCLRSGIFDRAVLLGQSRRAGIWHRGNLHRRRRSLSCDLSQPLIPSRRDVISIDRRSPN